MAGPQRRSAAQTYPNGPVKREGLHVAVLVQVSNDDLGRGEVGGWKLWARGRWHAGRDEEPHGRRRLQPYLAVVGTGGDKVAVAVDTNAGDALSVLFGVGKARARGCECEE